MGAVGGATAASAVLFHGCRTENDFICDDEYTKWLQDGTLSGVFKAVSRPTQGGSTAPKHVTDALLQESALVVDLLARQKGTLLACGPKPLYASLETTLKSILSTHVTDGTGSTPTSWWDDAVADGRIIFDNWSTA
jgi:sulfite reductase alpha subunit-like flavoprotein